MLELDKIYCMDCLEGMKQIENESIDLILTDPPYNMNKEFAGENLDINQFNQFHVAYLNEFKRIIKPHKPIIICFGNGEYFDDYLCLSNPLLNFKRFITIYKPNDCSYPTGTLLRKSEAVLVFSSNGSLSYEGDKNIHDVLISNHGKKDITFWHPSVKPLKIISDLVLSFSKKNDLILDCFMGSGTTAVACNKLSRHFIGFEINPEYVKMAKKRLSNVPNKLELFINDSKKMGV